MSRIHYTVTAARGDYERTDYAVQQPGESPVDAVYRSIATASGLSVCGGPRHDSDGVYVATLGQSLRSGGYSPEAEVWVRIEEVA